MDGIGTCIGINYILMDRFWNWINAAKKNHHQRRNRVIANDFFMKFRIIFSCTSRSRIDVVDGVTKARSSFVCWSSASRCVTFYWIFVAQNSQFYHFHFRRLEQCPILHTPINNFHPDWMENRVEIIYILDKPTAGLEHNWGFIFADVEDRFQCSIRVFWRINFRACSVDLSWLAIDNGIGEFCKCSRRFAMMLHL